MIYDTLKLSKALRVSFTPEQAETLAQAFSESTEDNVATKLDIADVKTQIAQLTSGMAELRTELKGDIAELRTELKGDIAGLRTVLKGDIAGLKGDMAAAKVDMVRWIVGSIAFNLLGTLGLMIGVAELVSKAK